MKYVLNNKSGCRAGCPHSAGVKFCRLRQTLQMICRGRCSHRSAGFGFAANDTGISAVEVEKIMDGIFGTIGDVLKAGDKVTIAGFGRFEMRERQTKNFTNPKTKVTSQLEPTAIPGFKASGRLKEKVGK